MYFWNINALIEDLRLNKVTERDKMLNFLVTITILVLIASSALDIILFVVGIILCFRTNSNGDNKNFIDRVICLSVPIFSRLFPVALILYFGGPIIVASVFNSFELIETLLKGYSFKLIFIFPISVLYYTMLKHYVGKVSSSLTK